MQHIVAEIRSAKHYIEARRRLNNSDTDLTQILCSFCDRLSKMIESASLSSAEVSAVMNELEGSPYGDDKTAILIQALDNKVLNPVHDQPVKATKQCSPTSGKSSITAWWNYFTDEQWAMLQSERSFFAKSEFAVHTSRAFGCVDPDEQSCKWLLATLLKLHGAQTTALQRFQQFNDLKTLFVSEANRKSSGPAALSDYPKDTKYLPESVSSVLGAIVCRDGAPEVTGIRKITHSIPMRKSSALLKGWTEEQIHAAMGFPSKSKIEPQEATEPKIKTEVDKPKVCKVEPTAATHKFCPECGHSLCSHSLQHPVEADSRPGSAPIADDDSIRNKVRINGQKITTHACKSEPAANQVVADHGPPPLDAHALAAIEALKLRKDKKRDLELDEDNTETPAKGVGKPAPKKATGPKNKSKKPPTKKPAAARHTIKRPAAAIADPLKRTGCMKCRGNGCSTCAALDFGGQRITRKKWLTLGLK